MFWQKGNFILPFAVNVMLNLSTKNASNEALPARPTVITAIAGAPCSVVICNNRRDLKKD